MYTKKQIKEIDSKNVQVVSNLILRASMGAKFPQEKPEGMTKPSPPGPPPPLKSSTWKRTKIYFERRGNMVYTEELNPGKAIFLLTCHDSEEAQEVVDKLNAVTVQEIKS